MRLYLFRVVFQVPGSPGLAPGWGWINPTERMPPPGSPFRPFSLFPADVEAEGGRRAGRGELSESQNVA